MKKVEIQVRAAENGILLSVKPQYASLLVLGYKTIELRRKFPTQTAPGTRCFIYSTSPVQMVIGECKIASVKKLPLGDLWTLAATKALVPWHDFKAYFHNVNEGYAIEVYSYFKYERPKTLNEVSTEVVRAPQSYRYLPLTEVSANL